ncbi:MAG: hypothetical protein CMJ18_21995 [Phycisphaeraceae bacterium]|nr:hypothetical protein [Phycisphaeraceae bacterium]
MRKSEELLTARSADVLDTLRDCESTVREVLDKKSAAIACGEDAPDKRQHDRIHYEVPEGLMFIIQHPGGSAATYLVRPYNLSDGGVGFLHGAYIHPGSACLIRLKTPSGSFVESMGSVVRCSFETGKIHDVGVKFDKQMPAGWYDAEVVEEQVKEDTGLPVCTGRVLYLTASKNERELMQYQLEKLHLTLVTASGVDEAMKCTKDETFNIVMTSVWIGDDKVGLEFAKKLKEGEYPYPIVAVWPEGDEQEQAEAEEAGCSDVLTQPYEMDHLLPVFRKYLVCQEASGGEVAPLYSSRWMEQRMRPMILSYLDEMEKQVQNIQDALNGHDNEHVLQGCRKLKSTAGGFGFAQIVDLSKQLEQLVQAESEAETVQDTFRELIAMCQSACLVRSES